jgi:hypothetical protein
MTRGLSVDSVDDPVAKTAVHWVMGENHNPAVLDAKSALYDQFAQQGTNHPAFDQLLANCRPAGELVVADKEELLGQVESRHRSPRVNCCHLGRAVRMDGVYRYTGGAGRLLPNATEGLWISLRVHTRRQSVARLEHEADRAIDSPAAYLDPGRITL